ncbi:hypothetical protein SKAU_G00361690 [Synaphobranchus kaupii]|uniref:Reverse transcriptase domain-containing protein n=1 Tax=Synaphobranchus kaupii TaxID=118154 RepID=A0A9Q1EIG5_SYNKA|nr:hypothetical protein SKAU_G00361690 [Synaphobranchus kaupii]
MQWNFRKANWMKYSKALDWRIVTIPLQNITVDEAYNHFCRAIYKAAHTAIPRGYRPLYVPCLDGESAALLQAYETSGDPEIADHLIESLTTAQRKKWEETVAERNFTQLGISPNFSRAEFRSLIRRLGAAQKPPTQSRPSVTPNQVSTHLLTIAKAGQDKLIRRAIMTELKIQRKQLREESNPEPFEVAELEKVLQGLKCGKAAGYDNISPEIMKHQGPRALTWLTHFYTRIIHTNSIPKKWRTAKFIAVPKPGVEKILCVDQAGFRKDRSTGEQVLALTTYIENGFESKLKTGTVFLDLTAAYDTVWHKGLLLKITKALPAWATATIKTLLTNRRFRVHLGQNKSAWRTQTNGLPQGSVLAPTLFNLYTNDLPHTKSRKFIYADDICLATGAGHWSRSPHTHHVDTQLNTTMRIITGTIRSTPLPWLPVLSNITPPHIRRVALTQKMLQKVRDSPQLPIHADIFKPPTARLPSRRPIWKETPPDDFTTQSAWEKEWEAKDVPNKHLVSDTTQQVPGTNLPRRQWTTLNRFRTGHGPCLASLHRWGSSPSPLCARGEEQTMEHIIEACPLQRLKGGLDILHTADQEATAWLEDFAFAK